MSFILALDQGTTSSRAIVFDRDGAPRAVAQKEIQQFYPKPGWVEHDPEQIWSTQISVATEALARARLQAKDVTAIGITNQRETTLVWDRETGEPIHRAIVWQDRRTAPFCDALEADGCETMIREKTGLVIDAYFSGSKVAWLLDNIEGARARAENGGLAFGTVDSWLVWKLTGQHLTDVTNASRTMLFNIHTGTWDDELLKLFRIPRDMLPEVCPSSDVYGNTTISHLPDVPIGGIAGDQQAALFGQACFTAGMAKNTYGTGCFALMNTADDAPLSKEKLITTVAWKVDGQTEYALEGSVFVAGAVVQWLRDGLKLIRTAREVEELATSVDDNGGVYLVPAFVGLGAPHWDPYARGVIAGLTRDTTGGHIARAALESIAYQVADILRIMHTASGIEIRELRVDGGAVENDFLMQFQADILGVPLVRPKVTESTALGAAYLAGLATGYWKNRDEIASQAEVDRRFEPQMSPDRATFLRTRWSDALERSKNWELV